MNRRLSIIFAAFIVGTSPAQQAPAIHSAVEVFPVAHTEPITVQVLGAKDGQPMPHLHLTLLAGYDLSDVHDRIWREETITDDQGRALLSNNLTNLPYVQVWVTKKHLCLGSLKNSHFSIELIRRDGLSTPNRCGTATVTDAPGILTVFVKARVKKDAPAISPDAASAPSPCRGWWLHWRAMPAAPVAETTPEPESESENDAEQAPIPAAQAAPARTAPSPAPTPLPPPASTPPAPPPAPYHPDPTKRLALAPLLAVPPLSAIA